MSEVNRQVDSVSGVISAVKCEVCNKLHDANGKTFVRLLGGIFEGMNVGLFGGGHVDKPCSTYYCKLCFVMAVAKGLGVRISIPREGLVTRQEKFSSSEDRVFSEDEGLEIQGR